MGSVTDKCNRAEIPQGMGVRNVFFDFHQKMASLNMRIDETEFETLAALFLEHMNGETTNISCTFSAGLGQIRFVKKRRLKFVHP